MRRLAILQLVMIAGCAVEMTGDVTGITLEDFDFNTDEVDPKTAVVTSTPEDVTCTLTITTGQGSPGIRNAGCVFISPGSLHTTSCITASPASGDQYEGVWECVATIPMEVEGGDWTVYHAFVQDFNYMQVSLNAAELAANEDPPGTPAPFPVDLVVTSNPDTTAPSISAFDITPLNANPGQALTLTVTATDAQSGIQHRGGTVTHPTCPHPTFDNTLTELSCLASGATTTCDTAPIPDDPSCLGTWTVVDAFVVDAVGNRQNLNTAQIDGMGEPTTVSVTGAGGDGGAGGAGGSAGSGGSGGTGGVSPPLGPDTGPWPTGPATDCTVPEAINGTTCTICEGVEYASGYCCVEGFSYSACSTTELYVSTAGSGAKSGADWDNALDGDLLFDNGQAPYFVRDRVYWIADGSYGTGKRTFSTGASGSLGITIRKASATMHGTETGWSPGLGDGQATFGQMVFSTNRWTMDGGQRNGIKATVSTLINEVLVLATGDYIALRNLELDGGTTLSGSTQLTGVCSSIRITTAANVVVDRCEMHDAADDGIEIWFSDFVHVHNSKIHSLPACGTHASCSGPCNNGHSDGFEIIDTNNVELKGNVAYDILSTSALIVGDTGNPAFTTNDLDVQNNIFYTPATGLTVQLWNVDGMTFHNNIVWGRTQGDRYGGMWIGRDMLDIHAYNNIFLNINFSHDNGTGYNASEHDFDYNQFGVLDPNEYPQNANDQVGDPLFSGIPESNVSGDHTPVDLLIAEFAQTPSSPTIDQGDTTGPDWDIIGVTRPLGLRDMGVYEVDGGGGGGAGGSGGTGGSAGTGGTGGAGGEGGAGGTGGAEPLFCQSLPVHVTAFNRWFNVNANNPADADLSLDIYARTNAGDAIVAIGDTVMTAFNTAAMLVRFNPSGLFDAQDGVAGHYGCGEGDGDGGEGDGSCVIRWDPDTWYRILITANVAAETYTVQIGRCDDPLLPLQTLITNAQFRVRTPPHGSMTHYAAWGYTQTTAELSSATWNAGECIPLTCANFVCGTDNDDSCGDTIPESCGSCGGGEQCNSGLCCTLETCASEGYECDSPPDSCGGVAADAPCGTCDAPETCQPDFTCLESLKPNASNTGPTDPGAMVPFGGNYNITEDGTVVEDIHVTGGIYISANNVTVRNFKVTANAWYGVSIAGGLSGIVLEDGEVSGAITSCIIGVGFTGRRLYLHDCDDGIKAKGSGGPTLVEYSFIEKMGPGDGAHGDGVQTTGAGNDITFRYNNIYMPWCGTGPSNPASPNCPDPEVYSHNATFIIGCSSGPSCPITNYLIDNNWLNGGGWTIYCSVRNTIQGVTVTNNKFGRDTGWGLFGDQCAEVSGNTWEDTGLPAP